MLKKKKRNNSKLKKKKKISQGCWEKAGGKHRTVSRALREGLAGGGAWPNTHQLLQEPKRFHSRGEVFLFSILG